MKKFALVIFLLLVGFPSSGSAFCEPLVEVPSAHFQVFEQEMEVDFCHSQNPVGYAYESLRVLEERLDCEFEPTYKSLPVCEQVDPQAPYSMVCYYEARVGSFVLSFDFMGNVNISFSKWD